MEKRILFISNLYPNPLSPNMAAFNRQQIWTMSQNCEVEVIAPVPWTLFVHNRLIKRVREENGILIHHPIYYYTPRIMRDFYGDFFYHSIKKVATSLLQSKKFDLIFSSWLYPDSWAAAKLAKQFNLPLFVKVHGTDVNRLAAGTKITEKSLQVVNQAEKVICVSEALKDKLVELGASVNKLETLYNGVDRTVFYPMNRDMMRERLQVEPNELLVLYVGNLKKEKGLYELIISFKEATEAIGLPARLIIIGSGPYRSSAEQLVSSLNCSRYIQFLGSQPLEAIARWMNAASFLCLPSYMEGVPNVVLEALSCRTKVVATSVGGIPELDQGQGNLRLVKPRSVPQLRQAFEGMLLDNTPCVESTFISTWQENAASLLKIFHCTT